jgi:transcriptional regulator GlxA family with amidase domain
MTDTPAIQRVAVVLFDGFTVLDMYGPVQAFGACRITRPDGPPFRFFEVFTIAEHRGPIKSGEGPSTHADYTFAEAPPYDILLVPGGFGTREAVKNDTFLGRLRASSEKAAVTATVCTGSALLARTGLMDGRPATSNKIAWDWVVQQGPKVLWKRKARWVDDGNLITSSGVSAGTDMALALIARLHGRDMAVSAARNMEYLWHEKADDDPFA